MELLSIDRGGSRVAGRFLRFALGIALAATVWTIAGNPGWGQLPVPESQSQAPNPLADATATPGKTLLYNLEAEFEKAVAEHGGAGFASWFADDAVVLGNGTVPVVGKVAIAQSANWTAKNYQLTWTPAGAWMNAAGDSGYTWGHYDGRSKDANGNPVTVSGRYFTLWGKQPDGSWKVELEASANEPPAAGDCCRLPGK